jgi:C-terminal processing protease CtpA/Prc
MNPIRSLNRTPAGALVAAVALALGHGASAAEAAAPAAPAPAAQAAQTAAAQQASRAEMERQLAAAQKELEVAAGKVAELSRQMGAEAGGRFQMRFAGGPVPRAMLGVQISSDEGQGGARIVNVSPGGPAAEAGIKAGDLITSIGSEDLTKDSNPGRALVERMSQMDPKLKVQVGVLRDGKKLNVEVTPRPMPDVAWGGPPPFGMEGPRGPRGGMASGMVTMPMAPGMPAAGVRNFTLEREDGMGQRFRGMEFATLSEQLGSYFGVKSGVLVVRAGNSQEFKLKDGDVILAIGGREPTSAQHAGRILRSYQAGEKLTIRIQRDRKAQNIEVTVPSGRDD